MAFYDDMAETARELIAEFGQSITIQRKTDGTFDKATGIETGGSESLISTTGVFIGIKADLIDGQRIKSGDRMLVLSDLQVPVLTDKIKIGSVFWSIQNIEPKSPAGTDLVYFTQVRA